MKKGIFAIGMMLSVGQLQAQTKIGVHVGTDLNNISITGIPDAVTSGKQNTANTSYGIHTELPMTDQLSFRTELNVTKKGFALDQTIAPKVLGMNFPIGVKAETSLSYLEMPLLLAYNMPVGNIKLIAEAGPVFSYGMTGKIEPVATLGLDFNLPDVNINFANDGYQRLNSSATIGIGVESQLSDNMSMFAKTRYTRSFTDILDNPIIDIKTRANTVHFGIGINYAI